MLRRNGVILAIAGGGVVLVLAILGFRPGRTQREVAPSIGNAIGQRMPAIAVATTDGTTLRSDELRGQVVVLTSSAAWCQTCALEAAQLASVYRKYGERGTTFLTVDIDPRDTPEVINAFRTRMQTPWVYAPANGAEQLIRDFGLTRFEITYVIDAQGIVRYRDASITNAADLENTLWPLL